MLLNLYIKGYTHVNFSVYTYRAELTIYAHEQKDLEVAETIIRSQLADGDSIQYDDLSNTDGPLFTIQWRSNFIETEDEQI